MVAGSCVDCLEGVSFVVMFGGQADANDIG